MALPGNLDHLEAGLVDVGGHRLDLAVAHAHGPEALRAVAEAGVEKFYIHGRSLA
jgi:hypothetical protein